MGRRRPSVFLVYSSKRSNEYVFFLFRCAYRLALHRNALHCAPAGHQRKEAHAKRLHGTPSSRLPERARRGSTVVAVATSREVRRATSTKPPIPLAHALERRMLDSKRGVARRRQGPRVALRLRGVRHPHITPEQRHGHRRIPNRVVGHIWGSNSSQPHFGAVVLREVDVARTVPRSE